MSRLVWITLALAVIAGTIVSPTKCRADGECPWLNAATARGVLGGDVQMAVSALSVQGDATCEFKSRHNSAVYTLRIAVHTMALSAHDFPLFLAQCGGTTVPLTGIGNEAVQCVAKSSSDSGTEQIIGRVRDRAFVLAVRANSAARPTAAKGGLSDDTRNVAEQVAGALF